MNKIHLLSSLSLLFIFKDWNGEFCSKIQSPDFTNSNEAAKVVAIADLTLTLLPFHSLELFLVKEPNFYL